MGRQLRGSLMLFTTALIWGTAFVAQKSGMDAMPPVAFNGIRTVIGGIALLPVIYIMTRVAKGKGTFREETPQEKKTLWIGGICCGLALCAAGNIQQIGMCYTTAGKTGFITALYVILVPLLGLILKQKIRPIFWACVVASAIGLYLLCIPADGGFGSVNKGDLIILLCSLMFAFHILTIDCLLMFISDPALGFSLPTWANIQAGWFEILYAGIMSCGVAYTLQVVGQKDVEPTLASMILCLESVFAVIAGAILLGETMGPREIIGCVLMFVAIMVAQLPSKDPAAEIEKK